MQQCKASLHLGKRYSQRHNRREYEQGKWNKDGHINPERSTLNEAIVDIKLKDFFEQNFGEAISDYNKKNKEKHPERCTTVSQYYNKYKSHVQEAIIQIGDADTYQKLVAEHGEKKADDFYKMALKNALQKWKEDNPSLKVFGAYLHMDEATPHLHLDFLPVAESKRGLSVKVSMDGAMKAIGYARTKSEKYEETSYKRWLKDCRAGYEDFHQQQADELLGKNVLEILPSEPATRPHVETWQWRAERLAQQKQQLQADIEKQQQQQSDLQSDVQNLTEQTQKLKAEAEQAEREKLMAIEIPPRPATPTPPEKPKEPWYADRATEKQYKKDLKQYERDCKQYQIDLQQAQQAQRAWDTQYGLLDRVQTTERQQADTQAIQEHRAEQLRADAQALEQERRRLTQERERIPQRAEEIAQEQLSRSQQFAELMQVSQQWQDRYQQAFGKPYINTGEEQNRNADKTTQAKHDGRPWEYGD